MILFFDTETTGRADFRSPPDAKHQPRLVQLGAILTTDEGEEVGLVDLIVSPNGFSIPEEVSNIHGITTDKAIAYGIDESVVTHVFDQLLMQSNVAVCHNFQFDNLIMSRGSKIRADRLAKSNFCTMAAMTDICCLPGPYGNKWPRLQEAYQHAFGKEFDGAHNAMADVRACKDIYFWLKTRPTG